MNSTKLLFIEIAVLFFFMITTCTKNPSSPENNTGASVTDIDGNVYQTVKIGTQIWTVENLRTTKYNDGTAIPLVTDSAIWGTFGSIDTTEKYCYYNNTSNTDSIMKFGVLYNWYAVNTKKLAPAGWHVPTDAEWDTLQNYLITNGYNWDGTTTGNKIAKSLAAETDWHTYTTAGAIGNDLTRNNRSGFSALPGGYRDNLFGQFFNIGYECYLWSATENGKYVAYYRILENISDYFGRNYSYGKNSGISVRLVRDFN